MQPKPMDPDEAALAEFYRDRFANLLAFVVESHTDLAKTAGKAFRKWSPGVTPYWFHPATVSLLATHEDRLDPKTRMTLVVGLLLHDILEDTCAELPPHLVLPEERRLVEELTFHGGMPEEMVKVWDHSPLARLAKLFDKTHNLLHPTDAGPPYEKTRRYLPYVERLIADVVRNYGDLNIVMIARGVVAGTRERIRT